MLIRLFGILLIANTVIAQAPWKLQRDFSLAFETDYSIYKIIILDSVNKQIVNGFYYSDTVNKLFTFEVLKSNKLKDGYFYKYDTLNNYTYTIHFKDDIAIKLSYIDQVGLSYFFDIENNLLNGNHIVYYNNNGGCVKEYGRYKDNARIGEWWFCNSSRIVVEKGSYSGDYNRILYNLKTNNLITLNKYLDTIKVESLNNQKLKYLKEQFGYKYFLAFPIENHFKIGTWQYFSDDGKIVREETYNLGKLIFSKNY